MIKRILLVLSVIIAMHANGFAEWVSLNKTKASKTPPTVKVLSDDNSSTVIKIDIYGFELEDLTISGKKYQSVDLLTDIFSTEPGFPALSYISKILAIPDRSYH